MCLEFKPQRIRFLLLVFGLWIMFGAGGKRGLEFSTTVAWSSFDGVDLYRVILQHHLNR